MKILFVVTAFYPEQAIGSVRITKLAKFLHQRGESISVLSLEPSPWANHDETLWFEGLKQIPWTVIPQSNSFKFLFQRLRSYTVGNKTANSSPSAKTRLQGLKYRVIATIQMVYTLLKAIDWSFNVVRYAKNNFEFAEFDYIFCSYPSYASPISGMKLKKLGFGRNLVIDFRDPILYSNLNSFSLGKWIQNCMVEAADVRTYISNGVRRKITKTKISQRDLIVTNGFDPQDVSNILTSENKVHGDFVLKFVYTGAMYGGKRDLRPIFKALSNILNNTDYVSDNILFEYAGNEGAIFKAQAEEFNLHQRVSDLGCLTRLETLNLQHAADICLLATWNSVSEQGVLTGKVFEYFMLKKPIVAVVGGNLAGSEIFRIINEIDAGFCFESATSGAISCLEDWLIDALKQKIETGFILSKYNEKVNKFDLKQITNDLYENLSKISNL